MKEYSLKILELQRNEENLVIGLQVKGPYDVSVVTPKIAMIFDNGKERRRLPIVSQAYLPTGAGDEFVIFAKYTYKMDFLFFKQPRNKKIEMSVELIYGETVISDMPFTLSSDVDLRADDKYDITTESDNTKMVFCLKDNLPQEKEKSVVLDVLQSVLSGIWSLVLLAIGIVLLPFFIVEAMLEMIGCARKAPKNDKVTGLHHFFNHIRWRVNSFTGNNFGLTSFKQGYYEFIFKIACVSAVKKNRVVFVSSRRNDLTGNFQFVHHILKERTDLDLRYVLDDRNLKMISMRNLTRLAVFAATSKVILVDDFTPLLYSVPIRPESKVIQLWHACGAFKTFGYGRLGKQGGQSQENPAHRNYSYAIVSSSEISKFYAEGFGISLEKAVATGVPRTDIFFDEEYKEKVTKEFYDKYPGLKDKKIILFAPTFRGNGKLSGHYPMDKFNVEKLCQELGEEYAIIIKHHPFVTQSMDIPEQYKEQVIDLSAESELNDLLFVTDLLITDYSSAKVPF